MDYKNYFKTIKLQNDFYPQTADRVFLESKLDSTSVPYKERVSGATDYVIATGANVNYGAKAESGRYQCATWLRSSTADLNSPSKPEKSSVCIIDNRGYVEFDFSNKDDLGIVPSFELDLKAIKDNTFGDLKTEQRGMYYHTIEFDKFTYPQTKVPDKTALKLEKAFITRNLIKTGKSYIGSLNEKCEFDRNDEFFFEGKKYVRVILTKDKKFNDGSSYKKGEGVWFEVEPVKFLARSWDALPKDINSQGNSTATGLRLRSEDALISGIPFDFGMTSNNWKNSLIRLYLNGEMAKANSLLNDKGKFGFNMTKTYDFRGLGFIDELYDTNDRIKTKDKLDEQKQDVNNSKVIRFSNNGISINNDLMTISEQIRFYINNGQPIMLHGPSGVGKSRRVKEIDENCITLALRNGILPEEIVGKTAYNDKSGEAKWIAPTWYDHLCNICREEPNKKHVLFIDEITNVRASEQSLVYNIVLNRTIDGQNGVLPENCVVVAAGNSIDESSAAYSMVEPLYRRFYAHIELNVDVKEFLMWGSEKREDGKSKIHPLVSAFIAKEGEEVLYSVYNEDSPFVQHVIDPRGWEQISDIIYDNNEVVKLELLSNKIGLSMAGKFVKFAQAGLLSPRQLLTGNFEEGELPKEENEVIALILRLRHCDDKREARKFIEKYYGDEKLSFYDSLSFIKEENEREIGG